MSNNHYSLNRLVLLVFLFSTAQLRMDKFFRRCDLFSLEISSKVIKNRAPLTRYFMEETWLLGIPLSFIGIFGTNIFKKSLDKKSSKLLDAFTKDKLLEFNKKHIKGGNQILIYWLPLLTIYFFLIGLSRVLPFLAVFIICIGIYFTWFQITGQRFIKILKGMELGKSYLQIYKQQLACRFSYEGCFLLLVVSCLRLKNLS